LEQTCELQSCSRESGFKSPMRQTHLTIYHAKNKQIQSNRPLGSFNFPKTQLVFRNCGMCIAPTNPLVNTLLSWVLTAPERASTASAVFVSEE